MVLCPFHRSPREICTRNRPVSETKFLDDFLSGPFLSRPLCFTADLARTRKKKIRWSNGYGTRSNNPWHMLSHDLRSGPPATGLRKPKSEKVLQRVPGKAGPLGTVLRGRFYLEKLFFPALSPALPALFWIWPFSVL